MIITTVVMTAAIVMEIGEDLGQSLVLLDISLKILDCLLLQVSLTLRWINKSPEADMLVHKRLFTKLNRKVASYIRHKDFRPPSVCPAETLRPPLMASLVED